MIEFLKGVWQLLKIIVVGIAYMLAGLFRGSDQLIRFNLKEVHMEVIKKLLSSRRVWLAFVALVVTAVAVVNPQVTPALVQAIQVFALALIAAFTVDDTAATIAKK